MKMAAHITIEEMKIAYFISCPYFSNTRKAAIATGAWLRPRTGGKAKRRFHLVFTIVHFGGRRYAMSHSIETIFLRANEVLIECALRRLTSSSRRGEIVAIA